MSWLVAILLVVGAFFAFVAALGVMRSTDFYTRMHAALNACRAKRSMVEHFIDGSRTIECCIQCGS